MLQGTITLILATDMARHGEILDSFKQKVDNFDYTDEEHVTCVRDASSLPTSNDVRTGGGGDLILQYQYGGDGARRTDGVTGSILITDVLIKSG